MGEEDKIQLTCPLCQKTHEFRLLIERSPVAYNMLPFSTGKREHSVKPFRCLFTCPEKNEPFEATIRIEEAFGEVVHGVKVR